MERGDLLMQDMLNDSEDEKYEEEWEVVMNTKGKYTLSKLQARILMQAMSQGQKHVVFKTFVISLPYVAEFYRVKRFLKGALQLPETATEKEYTPIDPERFAKIKEEAYRKIGKTIPKD